MNNEIPYIAGLRSVSAAYDAFIVDLWGVVYEEISYEIIEIRTAFKPCYGVLRM